MVLSIARKDWLISSLKDVVFLLWAVILFSVTYYVSLICAFHRSVLRRTIFCLLAI